MSLKMIKAALDALKYGQELQNPARWKKGQELTNLVGGLVAAGLAILQAKYPDIKLPGETQGYLAELIVAALVLINLFLTRATSKKIGSGAPKDTADA